MTTGEVIALIKAFGGSGGGSSGGGVLVVGVTYDGEKYVSDKTAAEIWASMKTGIVVFNDTSADEVWVCIHAYIDSGTYDFQTSSLEFTADSGAGYPESYAG